MAASRGQRVLGVGVALRRQVVLGVLGAAVGGRGVLAETLFPGATRGGGLVEAARGATVRPGGGMALFVWAPFVPVSKAQTVERGRC